MNNNFKINTSDLFNSVDLDINNYIYKLTAKELNDHAECIGQDRSEYQKEDWDAEKEDYFGVNQSAIVLADLIINGEDIVNIWVE